MASMRVYQLAKDLNVASKDLLAFLRNDGTELASHMSKLTDEQVDALTRQFGSGSASSARPEPEPDEPPVKPSAHEEAPVQAKEPVVVKPQPPAVVQQKPAEAPVRSQPAPAAPSAPAERPPVRTVPLDRIFGPGKGRRPGGPIHSSQDNRPRQDEGRPQFQDRRDMPQARRPPVSGQGEPRRGGGPPQGQGRPDRFDRPDAGRSGPPGPRQDRFEPRPGGSDRHEPRHGQGQDRFEPRPGGSDRHEPRPGQGQGQDRYESRPGPDRHDSRPGSDRFDSRPGGDRHEARPGPARPDARPGAYRSDAPPRPDRPDAGRFERVERPGAPRPAAFRTDRGPDPRRPMGDVWVEDVDLSAAKDKATRAERVQGKAKDVKEAERSDLLKEGGENRGTERRRVNRVPDRRRPGGFQAATPVQGSSSKKRYNNKKKDGQSGIPQPLEALPVIQIPDLLSVKEFADLAGKGVGEVIKELLKMGQMMTANQTLNPEMASKVGARLGVEVQVQQGREEFAESLLLSESNEGLRPRSPVITVMGHVDHGKTSLLDAIRSTEVAASEAGGITQHIGASVVHHNGQGVVFLDTPGHEAFTAMRSRGAEVTDIVVLVVAADDGVMPQTVEAVNHAKSAEVPILVAVNKIDKPGADPQRIKNELARYGLNPEEWGGQTIYCEVSAKKSIGLDHLLDMLLLLAEVQELRANPDLKAHGTVIEAKLDRGRGPVATVLIQNGTLRVGDPFVCGSIHGKVRALHSDKGGRVQEAGPSTPVEIIGLAAVPDAGDTFHVVDDEGEAKLIAQKRAIEDKRKALALQSSRMKLEDLFARIQEGDVKELNILLKADVQGSVEAISEALSKLSDPKVKVQVIGRAVGTITESDVLLATTTESIIVGYNVVPEPRIRKMAEEKGVDIRLHTIIYEVLDEIRAAMEGLLDPTFREEELGRAEVRNTFSVPKVGVIAGCMVTDGKVVRSANARLLREGKIIWGGKVSSLKRFKDDAREVAQGFECGIGLEGYSDIKVGDVIMFHTIVKEKSTLS